MRRTSLIVLAASALLATAAPAGARQPPAPAPGRAGGPPPPALDLASAPKRTFAGGVTGAFDITYARPLGFRPLKLDLYLPPGGDGGRPVVVWLHGGGWFAGDPRAGTMAGGPFPDWPPVLAELAARGYVVAGVSYRFSGEARFPAALQDVKSAVRWLRVNAGALGADPSRVVVWGASAGGQLAALMGVTCDAPGLEPPAPPTAPSACVQGVVDWYGPVDFARLDADALPGSMRHAASDSPESRYLGCPLADCPADTVRAASALSYVAKGDPPFLIMHGDADTSVNPLQSRHLYEALKAAGVKAELVIVPGANHSFVGVSPQKGRPLLEATFAFIDRVAGRR